MEFTLNLEQVNSIMAKLGNIPYMYSNLVIAELKSYLDPQYVAQAQPIDPAEPVADTPAEQATA
jgi:hypothetical protein